MSLCILRPWKEHVELLQEGCFLFGLLESGLRKAKIPLPELFGQIAERTESKWHLFFGEMQQILGKGPDIELSLLFEQILKKNLSMTLPLEEIRLFSQFGRGILTGDMVFQKHNLEEISSVIHNIEGDLRKQLSDRTKVIRVFCFSMSLLIILFLL